MSQTQKEKLGEFFKSRPKTWIPLPAILSLGIAQYNARIHELRIEDGMNIENRVVIVGGERHSSFMYIPNPIIVEPSGQFALAI